jgi:hypothetical protein
MENATRSIRIGIQLIFRALTFAVGIPIIVARQSWRFLHFRRFRETRWLL